MINEPTTATYSDEDLQEYVLDHALPDTDRTPVDHENWIPTYDLHAVAALIWEEKAAGLVDQFDFNADGASYQADQQYQHYMNQARYHQSRRAPKTYSILPYEEEPGSGPQS
jgi:hypothetical protein